MTDNTGLNAFAKTVPERFFDVGMAEEHAVTFSAGLAAEGIAAAHHHLLARSCSAASTRSSTTSRCRTCKIVLCLDRAGLVGDDGAPQHGVFDVGYLRMIPGMVVMQPQATARSCATCCGPPRTGTGKRPIAVRYPRSPIPEDALPEREPRMLEIGARRAAARRRRRRDLSRSAPWSLPALAAAELLAAQGVSATVVNARFVAPRRRAHDRRAGALGRAAS